MAEEKQAPPPEAKIMHLLSGAYVSGAVSCVAQLGIADILDAGPKSAAELATQVKADATALYRLMRATASVGVFAEGADGKFSQTPASAVLRSDANPSLRALAIMYGHEWHIRGWEQLEYCVKTGKTGVEKTYGMPIFEYLKQHPKEAQVFNDAMTSFSMMDSPAVVDAYSFEGIHSIVDVAGGHGLLMAKILERHPGMRGTLYDLPEVMEGAKSGPLKNVMDRCTLQSGDMFSTVPAGVDAYIMKHIIHDWADEQCIRLLKACRKSVNAGGKLLVVDSVIQPGNDFAPGKFLDLQMLVAAGGCERTEKQFSEIFAASGWKLNRVIPMRTPESIVEGIPV
jgi:O-methyltransferase domain/Dimerisation domain